MYSYYGQNGVWNIQAKQVSWVVQRILKATQYVQEAGYIEACIKDMKKIPYWQSVYAEEYNRGSRVVITGLDKCGCS